MTTPHDLFTNVVLHAEVPLHQFETDTIISAWCTFCPDPTRRTVMLLKRNVLLWVSRAELAPILFPDPPPEPEDTDVLAALQSRPMLDTDAMPEDREIEDRPRSCAVCQDYHDRYISAYPDRAIRIGQEWDAHQQEAHPRPRKS